MTYRLEGGCSIQLSYQGIILYLVVICLLSWIELYFNSVVLLGTKSYNGLSYQGITRYYHINFTLQVQSSLFDKKV